MFVTKMIVVVYTIRIDIFDIVIHTTKGASIQR